MYEVTIAIPVYNAVNYIRKTIESVLSQTFTSIEILVIDDKGSDESLGIIKECIKYHPLKSNVKFIDNIINRGVSYSRNVAIKEASGRFLFFLDADDYLYPRSIELLYKSIINENVNIVIGSHQNINDSGNIIDSVTFPNIINHEDKKLAVLRYGVLHQKLQTYVWNVLFDLSFLRNNNIFFKNYSVCEDVIFWYDLYPKVSSFVLMSDVTYNYVIHANSLSNFNDRKTIPLSEIKNQISVFAYENHKLKEYIDEPYFNNLCVNIMRDCMYGAIHILKKRKKIQPSITNQNFKDLFYFPLSLHDICTIKSHKIELFIFYILSKLPILVTLFFVKCIMKKY